MTPMVNISVELEAKALIDASRQLAELAEKLVTAKPSMNETQVVETAPAAEETQVVEEVTAAPAPPAEETQTAQPIVDTELALDSSKKHMIPWDARIHSAGDQRINKGGDWKVIRGIEKKSPGLLAQVEAELIAAGSGHTVAEETTAPAATPTTPATPAAATPPPPPAATVPDFSDYIVKLNEQGKLNGSDDALNVTIANSFKDYGISSYADLLTRTDLHETADQWFKAWVAA